MPAFEGLAKTEMVIGRVSEFTQGVGGVSFTLTTIGTLERDRIIEEALSMDILEVCVFIEDDRWCVTVRCYGIVTAVNACRNIKKVMDFDLKPFAGFCGPGWYGPATDEYGRVVMRKVQGEWGEEPTADPEPDGITRDKLSTWARNQGIGSPLKFVK